MERANFNIQIKPKSKVKFRFQETCLNLAQLSGLAPGVLFALWKKVGNEIFQIEAEINSGEIKKPKVYILWKLKKYN